MSEGAGGSRPSSYSRRSSDQSQPRTLDSRYGSSLSHQQQQESRWGSSTSHPNIRDSRYSSSQAQLSPISPGFSDHSITSPLMPPSPAYSPAWGRTRSPSPGQTADYSPQDTFGLHTPTTNTMLSQGFMPDQPRVPSPRLRSSDSEASDPLRSTESIPLARHDPETMHRSVESIPLSGGTQSQRSSWQRSSWQHASTVGHSDAAIEHARKQRVSQNPPQPGRPYQPGRFSPIPPLPEVSSLLSSIVYSDSSSSPRSVEPAADSSSGAETSSQLAAMSQQSHAGFSSQSHAGISQQSHGLSQQSQRTRSPLPPADVPVTPDLEGISQAVTTPSYNAASAIDLRRYSFLDVDPTEVSTPARGGGVSTYSSPNVPSSGGGNRLSVPGLAYGGRRISGISGTSTELSGIITFGGSPYGAHSETDSGRGPLSDDGNGNRFGLGPPIPWGKRDSATPRSRSSLRSIKSSRRGGNGGNGRDKPMPPLPGEEDEVDSELYALVARAAAVERMLQAGKRASLMTTKSFHRWSMSTRLSTTSKRRKHRSESSDSPHRRLSEKSTSTSHSTSQRKSNVSARSSFRRRMQRRFLQGNGNGNGGSGGGSDSPTMSQQGLMDDDDPVNQLFDIEDASERSSITPRRRAISSNQHGLSELAEGEGTGVIVFPELAVQPRPARAPPHDGEVCAQACLPPSVAVPYRPLPRDYHAAAGGWGAGGGGGAGWGGSGGGGSSWSLSSWRQPLRNLRAGHGEKTWEEYEYEQGLLPGCGAKPPRRNRRTAILVILFCVIGVAVIAGLLGGLLGKRKK